MKKSYPYNVMSDKRCRNCGESGRIKKRMAEEHDAKTCFKCFEAIRFKHGLSTSALKKALATY